MKCNADFTLPMFPVYYEDDVYYEKDCGSLFLAFYGSRHSLNPMGGVYMSEGMWVYPDDSMDDY